MPRRRVVVGNWKMNPATVHEAAELAVRVREATAGIAGVELAVAPPYVAIPAVSEALDGAHLRVCAQDVHEDPKGAHTAAVPATMLRGLVTQVIVGHSEVRRESGDDDARVNAKLRRALEVGLEPIVCVGEELDLRRTGRAEDFVRGQVRAAFQGINADGAEHVAIAYEPIWAIGTGVPATGGDAQATIAAIREEVRALYGDTVADALPILYGGSVSGATIGEFAGQSDIDGALVGGASLDAEDFARIARSVAS